MLLFPGSPVHSIELYRGAAIPGIAPRYWEVEDTTLDSTAADENQGWQTELDGGDGKTILIQFRGLNRALGPNKKIVKASLVFSLAGGDKIQFAGIGKVLRPWNQGPMKTLLELNPSAPIQPGAPGSATWRHRRLGMADGAWQHVGATGPEDSTPISEAASSTPDQDHFEIDNLAQVVQDEYDHPEENHGFVLQFKGSVAFVSSKAIRDRPTLEIQYEDEPTKSGADLTVAYIERTPEYQRFQSDAGFTVQNQDGVPIPVLDHPLNALSQKWPAEGDQLTYVAHVKNVGTAPANGFTAQWIIDEQSGPSVPVSGSIPSGGEALVTLKLPFRSYPSDHRLGRIALMIIPQGEDSATDDKSLKIQQDALNIGVNVEKSFYERANAKAAAEGIHSFENWVQDQVAMLNHVYFPYSQFSFAPDGVVERLRIQRISVVPDGTLSGPQALPNGSANLNYDAELGFAASDQDDLDAIGASGDLPLLRKLCFQLGLVDLSQTSFPEGDARLNAVANAGPVSRGMEDEAPGLMGGGDTRDEAQLLPTQNPNYQPYADPVVDPLYLQPTDLLSASSVSELQTDLGYRRGYQGDFLYDTPPVTILALIDYNGNKLRNTDFTLYQMVNGAFSSQGVREFHLKTNIDGIATFTNRDALAGEGDTIATNHTLKPNPFGRVDYRDLNGAYLINASLNGVSEWAPVKLWQLTDSFHRGQKSVALLTVALNLPTEPLDESVDLARGKAITASNGTDYAPLLDGQNSTEMPLPTEPAAPPGSAVNGAEGGWLQIDMGRDWTVGEVKLIFKTGHMWRRFRLETYETGQKASDAILWSQEANWPWTWRNRTDPAAQGCRSVTYRGTARRFRYLRLVNAGDTGEAALAGIEIVPAKAGS